MPMKRSTARATERLWWFNPWNDLALAAGVAYFTPPKGAAALGAAGALLPMWLADEGDMVLAGGVNARWLDSLTERLATPVRLWDHRTEGVAPAPWGWSAAAVQYFLHSGFDAALMPGESELASWRTLSGRAGAERLDSLIFPDTFAPRVVTDVVRLADRLTDYDGVVVKTPWSCSGRGVAFYKPGQMSEALEKARAIINAYGYAVVEPLLNVSQEFGLLFDYAPGNVKFRGFSCTVSGAGGKYVGNIIAPGQEHFRAVSEAVGGQAVVEGLVGRSAAALAEVFGDVYSGPVGLDFLVGDGRVHLAEHNLRYTMGFVAAGFHDKTRQSGLLSVARADSPLGSDEISLTSPGTTLRFVFEELV